MGLKIKYLTNFSKKLEFLLKFHQILNAQKELKRLQRV